MARTNSEAERLMTGDSAAAAALSARLLKPRSDNLVERPWGGVRLRDFKRLGAMSTRGAIGESFELAADDSDDEARKFPSVIDFDDGSSAPLPVLLSAHADALLGAEFVDRYGKRLPLLPKLLDVAELLSIQAHPPGGTEVYVIVAADPGATIRLGFSKDADAKKLAAQFAAGRRDQQQLLDLCAGTVSPEQLQALLKPWLSNRGAKITAIEGILRPRVASTKWATAAACLSTLRAVYWQALDSMNAVPVSAGMVVHNSNPARIVAASGRPASAEIHALGSPEGRSLLALEIRRPGVTYRAWDNVRFPLRPIDIDATFGAVNLSATRPDEFIVLPRTVRAGVQRSVDSEYFRIEHLTPTALVSVDVPATPPHTLHALAGAVSVYATDGKNVGRLARGESALVPVGVGAYRVVADQEPALVIKAELPPYAA
ncbi:MAG: type I phosphomannose isomerase catalytic subunit [Gammaproteobacteria bacterium]